MPGFCTVYEGVMFVEGTEPYVRLLGEVKCDLSFKFGAQLKNLNDVKRELAARARNMGANAVLNFKYGQKSRWLAVDDVAFFGSGTAAVLSDEVLQALYQKIAAR